VCIVNASKYNNKTPLYVYANIGGLGDLKLGGLEMELFDSLSATWSYIINYFYKSQASVIS
tara:strand:+ start:290 stop:472 length:183 start_codon:yes stop_codon:yes gene_type:complete